MTQPQVTPGILSELQWKVVTTALRLSPREVAVAGLCLNSFSIERVANTLDLSPYTVRTYLKRIYAKAGVHSRYDLLRAVIAIGYAEAKRVGQGLA
jgi:DNA-binding CsgD family transcriptional regulator